MVGVHGDDEMEAGGEVVKEEDARGSSGLKLASREIPTLIYDLERD